MVQNCFICKKNDPGVSLHIFPVEPNTRKQWLAAFKLDEDDIFKNTRICSKHFTPECFSESPLGCRPILRKGSVPTLFVKIKKLKKTIAKKSTQKTPRATKVIKTPKAVPVVTKKVQASVILQKPTEIMKSEISDKQKPAYVVKSVKISDSQQPTTHISTDLILSPPTTIKRSFPISNIQQIIVAPIKKRQIDFLDNGEKNFKDPISAKRHYDDIAAKMNVLKEKMKLLQKENNGLRRKVNRLENLLFDTNKKKTYNRVNRFVFGNLKDIVLDHDYLAT